MSVWSKMNHSCHYFNHFCNKFYRLRLPWKLFCLRCLLSYFSQIYTFLWNGEVLDELNMATVCQFENRIKYFMENCSEHYCLNIIVNVSSFIPLNNNVNTSVKYYRKQALNKKLKLMREAMKYFTKKLLGHEIFSSMIHWALK